MRFSASGESVISKFGDAYGNALAETNYLSGSARTNAFVPIDHAGAACCATSATSS
jgi:hypothetical protein